MKKTISMLLVLSLLAGLVSMISFTAFAEDTTYITDVNVTGVVDAVVGQMPTTEGITTDAAGVTLEPLWKVYDWENQEFRSVSGAFEAGKVYLLWLVMDAQEGYEFDYDTMNYTVNGAEPDDKTYYWSTYVDMQMYYIMDGVTVIDALEIVDVPQIQVGDTISNESLKAEIVLPEGANYTVHKSTRWLEISAGHSANLDGTVTAQKMRYKMEISLAPKAGCWIARDASVTTPAGMDFTEADWDRGEIELKTEFDLREQVQTVSLTGVPTPTVGDPITCEGITVTGGVLDAESTSWYDSNWNPVTGNFADDTNYILEIYIDAAEGTYYTDDVTTVNINGAPFEGDMHVSSGYVRIEVEANFEKETATYAKLAGLPASIAAGTAAVPTVSVDDGNVEIVNTRWLDENGEPVTAFETGKGYYLEVSLKPAEGFKFDDWFDAYDDNNYAQTEIAEDGASAKAYFYYSLKPPIEKVELTVSGVEVGKNIADIKVTVPTDAKYTCEDVGIYDATANEYVESGTFQDKHRYELRFYLEPAEGCDFSMDLEVLINGEDPNYYDGDVTYIYVYEDYSFRTKIDKVELTVTEPVIGGSIADSVVKVPEDANYEVDYWWYDVTSGQQVETGTFQDDHRYELGFDVYPKADYEFSADAVITLNGAEPGQWYINQYSGEYGYGYESWTFLTPIAKVEFPAFPEAKVGDSTQVEITAPEGANYTLIGVWTTMDGGEPETLEDGNVYMLMYAAAAAEGYEFTEDTVITVDGKEYSGFTQSDYGQIAVGKAYSFGMQLIEKVELTITEPANGEKPGKIELADENANYSLGMAQWMTNTSGDAEGNMADFNRFQYGNYYYLTAYVVADEGCAFADDVKVYINGEEAELALGYNFGVLYIAEHSFGKLEEAKQPDTPAAPGGDNTPSTGSNAQTGDSAPIAAMVILLVLAAAGLAVVVLGRKKFAK